MFRFELARIGGIPVYLDMFFVLVLLLFSYPYFTAGSTQAMSAGFVIVVGILLSILLHELGHAFAGWLFKANVSHIELTGIGGVAHFERSLPTSTFARTVIYLAGPAANLALWWIFGELSRLAASSGAVLLAVPFMVLASINLFLMIFNLLPGYPLDGGHTLDAWLAALFGTTWATRVVAVLGLVIAAFMALWAFQGGMFFMLFVAFFIGQANWEALQSVGRWRR
jgi:Zn-dependent protease